MYWSLPQFPQIFRHIIYLGHRERRLHAEYLVQLDPHLHPHLRCAGSWAAAPFSFVIDDQLHPLCESMNSAESCLPWAAFGFLGSMNLCYCWLLSYNTTIISYNDMSATMPCPTQFDRQGTACTAYKGAGVNVLVLCTPWPTWVSTTPGNSPTSCNNLDMIMFIFCMKSHLNTKNMTSYWAVSPYVFTQCICSFCSHPRPHIFQNFRSSCIYLTEYSSWYLSWKLWFAIALLG